MLHHHPAINAQHLAGDVTGFRRSEERDRARDIFRRAGFAERDLRLNRLLDFVRQSRRHVRRDKPGRDCVHGDAAAGQFARERFGQTNQTSLARGVIGLSGIADQSDHGTDVNDAAAALFDHRAHDRLREIKCAAQVRVDNCVPIFDRHAHGQARRASRRRCL